jgi:hypothetical protein
MYDCQLSCRTGVRGVVWWVRGVGPSMSSSEISWSELEAGSKRAGEGTKRNGTPGGTSGPWSPFLRAATATASSFLSNILIVLATDDSSPLSASTVSFGLDADRDAAPLLETCTRSNAGTAGLSGLVWRVRGGLGATISIGIGVCTWGSRALGSRTVFPTIS